MKKIFLSFYLFVLITLAVLEFGFGPIVEIVVRRHIEDHLTHYYRDLVKGTYNLLREELHRHPQHSWPAQVADLQPRFGYPISLAPYQQIDLSPQEQAQLLAGQIVVKGDGDLFHQRIGQADQVLTMGPFAELEPEFFILEISLYAAVFVTLGLITMIWVLPFYRKLTIISNAALAFGNGDFSRRAILTRRSALAPLAQAFNSMADRIQQLIKSHKDLTSAVSHELRTPIARIRFGMEMVDAAPDKAGQRKYVAGIRQDVDELDDLVNELLNYSRLDRERPVLDIRPHQLVHWMQAIVTSADQAHATLDVSMAAVPDNDHLDCAFDARYLHRAVTNLLRNAMRYARQRITVSLRTNADSVAIVVDDDGPGIPAADREKIFEPFVRLDQSRSRESGGYGLGLAIVSQIARWHGGKVTATTSPDGGARFTLEWPYRHTDDSTPNPLCDPSE